ncbi:hypothetical protein N825_20730 [Skermanella stibiiresistens SB22]|uniref:TniQ domain-containing protein n=2 Tax=Skermanella TaxID=204447 RepID=W9GTQ3_9PROT|nr:hypothetical protein N825_20730 [Skermanella stibiiresistens SB22]
MGYLLRVSEANGCPDPYWLLRALGCSAYALATSGTLKPLADALSLEEVSLEALRHAPASDGPGSRQVRFGSGTVHRSAIIADRSRYCPICLAEEGFFQSVWQLKPVTACPKHGVQLLERCAGCGRSVSWRREELFRCPCGHDLRQSTSQPASPESMALSRVLMGKLGNPLHEVADPALLAEAFTALELADLVDHTLFIGAYVSGRGRGAGRQTMSRLMGDAGIDVFQRVAVILADWPKAFFALLDDFRRHGGEGATHIGLEMEFRSFYAALYSRQFRESGKLGLVRGAFETYLRNHWRGGFLGAKNRRLADDLHDRQRYVPLAKAARLIDMHSGALEREIRAGLIEALILRMGSRTLIMIDREKLEAYRLNRDQMVGLFDARRVLGLSKSPFLDLVRAGIAKAVRGPTLDGYAYWTFRKTDLQQLLDTILSGVPESKPGPDHIEYRKAVRIATYRGLGIVDFVKAILGRNLRVAGADPRAVGMERCYFDPDEFLAFASGERPFANWTASVEEAAAQLGLKSQVTYHLVRSNLIRSVSVSEGGKISLRVPLDAIREFETSYIPAAELAVRYGTSSRHLAAVLQQHGIVPVTGPTVDSGRQYFFSRSRLAMRDASEILEGIRSRIDTA